MSQKEIVSKIVVRACDFCDSEVNVRTCNYCKKDFCRDCGIWSYNNCLTGSDMGDKVDYICNECDMIVSKYAKRYKEVDDKYEKEIDEIKREMFNVLKERNLNMSNNVTVEMSRENVENERVEFVERAVNLGLEKIGLDKSNGIIKGVNYAVIVDDDVKLKLYFDDNNSFLMKDVTKDIIDIVKEKNANEN